MFNMGFGSHEILYESRSHPHRSHPHLNSEILMVNLSEQNSVRYEQITEHSILFGTNRMECSIISIFVLCVL